MRILALALLLSFAGPASAAPIDQVLAGIEHVPTPEEARGVGAQSLIDYAANLRHPLIRRVRAIAALRFVPGETARAYLTDLLSHRRKETTGAAALEVSAAIGALVPYGRIDLVMAYIAHESADVRQAAVVALALIGDARVVHVLRTRFAVELDPGVRIALEQSVRALDAGAR